VNVFQRSNLSVALLRLVEAQQKAKAMAAEVPDDKYVATMSSTIEWSVLEAMRQIENTLALEEVESADTLPMPPESGARRTGA
jgi:hypothetical protein